MDVPQNRTKHRRKNQASNARKVKREEEGEAKWGTIFCAGQLWTVFEARREFQLYLSNNKPTWLRKVTINAALCFGPNSALPFFLLKMLLDYILLIFLPSWIWYY